MRYDYVAQAQFEEIKPVSDLVLDWRQSAEDWARTIIKALQEAKLA